MRSTRATDERGAALLTVLLLVAVISLLANAALERVKLGTHLAGNAAAMAQARFYALAGERIAASRIALFNTPGADVTSLADGRAFPFPIDGGNALATLSDGGNCFNLNSLAEGNAETGLTARPTGIAQFAALMEVLGVSRLRAAGVAAAAADWIDSDTTPLPGGAEDPAYRTQTPGYRAANTLMVNPGELASVAGVDAALMAQLRPWLCALPTAELSPIGVDTLTPSQAPLVAMLVPGRIDVATAQAMIAGRPRGGFGDINRFWATPALAGSTPAPDVLAQTQLKPRWFRLNLRIRLGDIELEEEALIDGELQPAKIVSRRYGDGL